MRLSIVIPVYNAEMTIESLCKSLMDLYGSRFNLEIVLVNDNSHDSTHLICRRLNESYPDIFTYVRLSRNFGEHCAVMAGLNQATGDVCVVMDDDFQNPPEEVINLVEEIGKGYDVVYSQYPVKRDSIFRNLASLLNDKMANLILKKPADLYLSSFKIMNRFLVDEIVKYTGPDPYIDAIILRATSNIGKVEVRHDRRTLGHSGYTFKKLISLWGNMMVSCSLIPLRILGAVGLVMTLMGVYMAGETLVDLIITRYPDPTEYETLMSVSILTRGFLLLSLSVVGEYVGRIYLSLNSDPQYVIREKFSVHRKTAVVSNLKVTKNNDISPASSL
jgi:undecaprenyl-phosphate 4-deoxy-4-formamido-L-arabinose transferase